MQHNMQIRMYNRRLQFQLKKSVSVGHITTALSRGLIDLFKVQFDIIITE